MKPDQTQNYEPLKICIDSAYQVRAKTFKQYDLLTAAVKDGLVGTNKANNGHITHWLTDKGIEYFYGAEAGKTQV